MIAAAFYPKPVIVRMSDFKTNEYASLLGGRGFEPQEENPMIGFRGASRYTHPAYAEGFALECAAMKRVRDEMGLTNVKLMIPFCRRVHEAERVLQAMARARARARRERPRDLRDVRDSEQRDPDRRVLAAVRRLLDRLQRSDPARARASTAIRRSSRSTSTSATTASRRCSARRSKVRIATAVTSASAARLHPTTRRWPNTWSSWASTRSASPPTRCCRSRAPCWRSNSAWDGHRAHRAMRRKRHEPDHLFVDAARGLQRRHGRLGGRDREAVRDAQVCRGRR